MAAVDISRCRQKIRQIVREITEAAEIIMQRKRLLRGSIYNMKRRCGKPGCRCTRGQLHATECLSTSIGGKTRMQVLREGEIAKAREWSGNYRRFREAYRKIEVLSRGLLDLSKKLQEAQVIEINRKRDADGKTKPRRSN